MQTTLRALAVALVVMFGCGVDLSKPLAKPVTLNPDEHRPEITGIDRFLLSPKPYDDARRAQLATTLEGLASRITAGSESRFLKMEGSEIKTLASLAKHISASDARDHLQENWMRIRNNLFEDRSWMARSAADLQPE